MQGFGLKSPAHSTCKAPGFVSDSELTTAGFIFLFQLSVDYLTTKLSIPPGTPSIPNLEKADVEKTEKSGQLPTAKSSSDSVDVASCLKLLIDVYTHLLSPTAHPKTPLMLLNECAKSVST